MFLLVFSYIYPFNIHQTPGPGQWIPCQSGHEQCKFGRQVQRATHLAATCRLRTGKRRRFFWDPNIWRYGVRWTDTRVSDACVRCAYGTPRAACRAGRATVTGGARWIPAAWWYPGRARTVKRIRNGVEKRNGGSPWVPPGGVWPGGTCGLNRPYT